jgi:hypothetical protein
MAETEVCLLLAPDVETMGLRPAVRVAELLVHQEPDASVTQSSRRGRDRGTPVNAVERFVKAVNGGDVDGVEAAFHPDFEMIVPQHPARGFVGRDQEVKNMRHLITSHPEGRIEVKRMVTTPTEIWVQSCYQRPGCTSRPS